MTLVTVVCQAQDVCKPCSQGHCVGLQMLSKLIRSQDLTPLGLTKAFWLCRYCGRSS